VASLTRRFRRSEGVKRTGWPVGRVLSSGSLRSPGGDHPSTGAVADSLQRSTRVLGRAALERTRIRCPKAPDFLTLLQVGFAEPTRSPGSLVVSCTTVSPLPLLPEGTRGGLFSVALSRGLPRVGVTHHLALWSPDLPRRRVQNTSTRSPGQPIRGLRVRDAVVRGSVPWMQARDPLSPVHGRAKILPRPWRDPRWMPTSC
jgi:hypothetical protein